MTLYRKVFTKDRLPDYSGRYDTNNGGMAFINISDSTCEWWLEAFELPNEDDIYSVSDSFRTAEQMNAFEQGANYILNKLKG